VGTNFKQIRRDDLILEEKGACR